MGARYSPLREFPIRFLTDLELIDYENRLDGLIDRRRGDNIGFNCLSLYFDDLNELYQAKTGIQLNGDEDGDGIENHEDCLVYRASPEVCTDSFRKAIEMY